ncbi:MAG: porin [Balneolaceae bacterium]
MVRHLPIFIILLILQPVSSVLAQVDDQKEATQFDDDIRFPALPYYSYGSGLGLTTPDSTFRFNIRFRMQNRATFTEHKDRDDTIEAEIRRLRLRFDGFVADPRFLYAIQLSFSASDVGKLTEGDKINIVRDAVFFFQPNDNWSLGFGQTKLPGNRQLINSSGALQLTDRTINNATFSIDRDVGLFIYHLKEDVERTSYNIKTAISTGNGPNRTDNSDTRLAYTGRMEFFPFGAFQKNGMFFEGDLVREPSPKVLLSGTYHFNKGAQRERGQLGNDLFELRDLTSILLDGMLKYRGWAFQTAYMTRLVDNPFTVNPEDPDDIRFVFAGDGFDLQLSYLLPFDVDLIGRFSRQTPKNSLREVIPKADQFSFGITKYVWEHALKLQTELTYNNLTFTDGINRDNWYFRFQVEIGI